MESLTALYDLTVRLDVKRETDQGTILALAADHATGGTVVLFNKVFKDVDSIALTPNSILERTAIYNFVDIPDPVQFKVLVFDKDGNPVNNEVSWIARGIV